MPWRRTLARSLLALTVVLELISLVLAWGVETRIVTMVLLAVYTLVMAAAGTMIVLRDPTHAIGWLFCGLAVLHALTDDVPSSWAVRAVAEGWPGVAESDLLTGLNWQPNAFGLILTFLLFPDGHLPGRRWRWVPWVAGLGMCLTLPGWALNPRQDRDFSSGHNPFAVPGLPTDAMLYAGMALTICALAGAAASLILRYRRARGVERLQLKWFAFAAAVGVVTAPVAFLFWYESYAVAVLLAVALTLVPVAASIAILRHRLYDIEVIVDRTVVYSTVTVLLAVSYGITALLLGTALGQGSGWATAGATLVVAVAFRPVRDRVQDLADRHFQRARYEAVRRMTDFLDAVRAGAARPEDVQQVLQDLTADPGLVLLLFLPESGIYVDVDGVPAGPAADGHDELAVERSGRVLGVVRHRIADPVRVALLRRLVGTGALAIEIARLSVELRRQLAEVGASRARIVTAADASRRAIERNLHDGAQQHLVALSIKLGLARRLLDTDPARVGPTLDGLHTDVQATIGAVRELAHGIYPPVLRLQGLRAALGTVAARSPLPCVTDIDLPDRYPVEVETAVYFCCLEAIQNAGKHAGPDATITVALRTDGPILSFAVADDGPGLPAGSQPVPEGTGFVNMRDRLGAIGGSLTVAASGPDGGVTVRGTIPTTPVEAGGPPRHGSAPVVPSSDGASGERSPAPVPLV